MDGKLIVNALKAIRIVPRASAGADKPMKESPVAKNDLNKVDATKWPGFWKGKQPCWVVTECSQYVYPKCLAYLHPEKPCWQFAFTQSEKLLCVEKDCEHCNVFKLYHQP